jgi:hypothetical protein
MAIMSSLVMVQASCVSHTLHTVTRTSFFTGLPGLRARLCVCVCVCVDGSLEEEGVLCFESARADVAVRGAVFVCFAGLALMNMTPSAWWKSTLGRRASSFFSFCARCASRCLFWPPSVPVCGVYACI